jgi:tagatose 6-phosphate kinase
MILIINLNLTIDHIMCVERLAPGRVHRARSAEQQAGGKGVNVARALKILGDECLVTGLLGGHRGQWIEQGLRREGLRYDATPVTGESRTCLIVLDQGLKQTTVINEPGATVAVGEFDRWFGRYREKLLPEADEVILTGSFPPGVAPESAKEVLAAAGRQGKRTFLDTSGPALMQGFDARPFLIKINQFEAETLLGYQITEAEQAEQAAAALVKEGVSIAVITLGQKGAALAGPAEGYFVIPPKSDGWNNVGSGDSMMAGLVHGVRRGLSLAETGKLATAAAVSSLRQGFGRIRREDL